MAQSPSLRVDVDASNDASGWASTTNVNFDAPAMPLGALAVSYVSEVGVQERERFSATLAKSLATGSIKTALQARVEQSDAEAPRGSLSLRSQSDLFDDWTLSSSVLTEIRSPDPFSQQAVKLTDARLRAQAGSGMLCVELGVRDQFGAEPLWDASIQRRIASPLAAKISVAAPTETDRADEGVSVRIALVRSVG